jgi:hypothetical protein
MIKVDSSGGAGPRIEGWADSGGIAVISWRAADGRSYQQETGHEQEAVALLRKIEGDGQLTLISAQLRRVGIGPSG